MSQFILPTLSHSRRIMLRILLVCALILGMFPSVQPANADGGSYSFDFTAADPRYSNPPYDPTYPRYTPNGLACPTVSGTTGRANQPLQDAVYASPLSPYPKDAVDALAPGEFMLGQIVPFEIQIDVTGSTAPENGSIQFTASWNTKTSSNKDFGYDPAYMVYCAFVDTGDAGTVDPGSDANVDLWSSTLVNPGTGNEAFEGTFYISGLDTNDKVVIEVWAVLMDQIPVDANGDIDINGEVPAGMVSARTSSGDTIQTGNQTVPLRNLQQFITADADLSLTKTDLDIPQKPLSSFPYTVVVTNNSTDTVANSVIVTDTLDIETRFLSAQPADPLSLGRTCGFSAPLPNGYGGTVTCDLLALTPTESVTITVWVEVAPNPPVGSLIEPGSCTYGDHILYDLCNEAMVTAITDDPDLTNNYDTEPTDVIPTADLGISKICPPKYDTPLIDFILRATNYGPQPSIGVVMTDTLPAKTAYVGYQSNLPSGIQANSQDITFNLLNPLSSGITWVVTMTVDVSQTFSTTVQTIVNSVWVKSLTPEPNWQNNDNYDTCSSVTPVTIAHFSSTRDGDHLLFEWGTESENGNLGFNIYTEDAGGIVRLNKRLIPSRSLSLSGPQEYQYESSSTGGELFWLEEVNALGLTRRHGPFSLGDPFGQPVMPVLFDWQAARAELAADACQPEVVIEVGSNPLLDLTSPKLYLPLVVNKVASMPKPSSFTPINLLVDQDGLFRVTYEDLLSNGFNLAGVNPRYIALVNQGASIPIHVVSGATFGPGSSIEFVGRAANTHYTHTNTYTLVYNKYAAMRVEQVSASPSINPLYSSSYMETALIDKNIAYGQASPIDDPWFEEEIRADSDPVIRSFPIDIQDYQTESPNAALTVGLWGMTDFPGVVDHRVQIALNGFPLADVEFDGLQYQTIRLDLPPGMLEQGSNQLQVTLPGDRGVATAIALDRYQVTYPRSFMAVNGRLTFSAQGEAFEIDGLPSSEVIVYRSDATLARLEQVQVSPSGNGYLVRFSGSSQPATYLVYAASSLFAPAAIQPGYQANDISTNPAELLIISHPHFMPGLDTLVSTRRAQGFSVQVVDVRDIYAQYSGHNVDPNAIRAYITYAYQNLGARFILLVGNDTYDYLDYTGIGSLSFIPSLYGPTHPLVRHTALDAYYADVDLDGIPELAIGRFPVRTLAELATLVDKSLAYDTKNYPNSAVFTADAVDGGLSFAAHSDSFLTFVPSGWSIQKAYLDDPGGVSAARSTLLNGINQGVALVDYVGHSSDLELSGQQLFTIHDVNSLTNPLRPTVFTLWGCWNTYLGLPIYNTLAQSLLLSSPQGGSAVIGSATLTPADIHQQLGSLMLPRLMQSGMPIGEAVRLAKLELLSTKPFLADVLSAWNILGDPTLVISQ
jgi:hypothetical protein